MEKLNIETIKHKSSQLLGDLNMEKRIEIERKKEIKIKLEKLNTPKTLVDTIRKSIISKKYLYQILRRKKYCAKQKT